MAGYQYGNPIGDALKKLNPLWNAIKTGLSYSGGTAVENSKNRVKYEGLEEAKAVIEIIAQIKNQTTPQKG
jgi:hypothetical protein